jgi:HEAT repeat protein
MLADGELTVRAAAARALQGFCGAAVEALCESLAGGDGKRVTGSGSAKRAEVERHRALYIQTLGNIGTALRDSTDQQSLRARGRVRMVLMDELDRALGSEQHAERAAAVRALITLGEPETLEFVRLRMLDEFDPLVRRTYEKALEEAE